MRISKKSTTNMEMNCSTYIVSALAPGNMSFNLCENHNAAAHKTACSTGTIHSWIKSSSFYVLQMNSLYMT